MATLVDGYSVARDNQRAIRSGSYTKISQSFTGVAGLILHSVKLYLIKTGAPTGSASICVYAHGGTFGTGSVPSGSALATAAFDVSTASSSGGWVEVVFAGASRIAMAAQYYCVSYEFGGGDASNYVAVGDKESSAAHAGNCAFFFTPSWAAQGTKDLIFEVYGDAAGCPKQSMHLRRMMQ